MMSAADPCLRRCSAAAIAKMMAMNRMSKLVVAAASDLAELEDKA